jgi:polar amino acid transport system substrate-binding protein
MRRAPWLVGLAVLATACTTSTPPKPGASPTPAAVTSPIPAPAGLVTAGTLTVASDLSYPPQEYLDKGGKATGFDIDLAREIARRMGLQLKVVNYNVDQIIPDFTQQTRAYDFGISAQPQTATTSSTAHTLQYFVAGLSIITPSPDPKKITGIDSLCGLRVGAERGSSAESAITLENERPCSKNPIKYTAYNVDVDAVRDLSTPDPAKRKLDAVIDDYPVAVLFSRQFSGLRLVPHQFSTSIDVMVFPPGDSEVYNAVSLAFDRLRRDGTYRRLLKQWGLEEGELR